MSSVVGTIYLGLDVHKDSVTIAVLPGDAVAPTRVERLPNDLAKLRRFCERLAVQGEVRACYEASVATSVRRRTRLSSNAMRSAGLRVDMRSVSLTACLSSRDAQEPAIERPGGSEPDCTPAAPRHELRECPRSLRAT